MWSYVPHVILVTNANNNWTDLHMMVIKEEAHYLFGHLSQFPPPAEPISLQHALKMADVWRCWTCISLISYSHELDIMPTNRKTKVGEMTRLEHFLVNNGSRLLVLCLKSFFSANMLYKLVFNYLTIKTILLFSFLYFPGLKLTSVSLVSKRLFLYFPRGHIYMVTWQWTKKMMF